MRSAKGSAPANDIVAGQTGTIPVPGSAVDIRLTATEFTGFGWNIIFEQTWATPPGAQKCYRVTGTTFSPQYVEIACS